MRCQRSAFACAAAWGSSTRFGGERGAGFESDRAALLSGVGVALGLDATLRVSASFGISALGSARVNTLERRFVYDDATLGFSVPRVSYLVSLGPSYRF